MTKITELQLELVFIVLLIQQSHIYTLERETEKIQNKTKVSS